MPLTMFLVSMQGDNPESFGSDGIIIRLRRLMRGAYPLPPPKASIAPACPGRASLSTLGRCAAAEAILKTFSFAIFAQLLLWPVAAEAQLNVLISGGFSGAYERLLPEFERASGIKVT